MGNVLTRFTHEFGEQIIVLKNKWKSPQANGYSDINLVLKVPGHSMLAEVQFQMQYMQAVKSSFEHLLYEDSSRLGREDPLIRGNMTGLKKHIKLWEQKWSEAIYKNVNNYYSVSAGTYTGRIQEILVVSKAISDKLDGDCKVSISPADHFKGFMKMTIGDANVYQKCYDQWINIIKASSSELLTEGKNNA